MTRQDIKGIQNHPNQKGLASYAFNAPNGEWVGKLDDRAWGKSQNLFCYFTDMTTGTGHRLSVFNQKGYRPYKDGPKFDHEPLGQTYKITTESTDEGLPKFLKAELL